ncbi:MAG: hypothetical protein WBA77_07875 [Microcoleaceae cyanobacterium]
MNHPSHFQPQQIVGLECQNTCLYAEVIQVVTLRQMCWVRPLMLVEIDPSFEAVQPFRILSDLRQGSDLILPVSLFRAALDTEVIPLLMQLDAHPDKTAQVGAHKDLQAFIRRVWQVSPEVFGALNNQTQNQTQERI